MADTADPKVEKLWEGISPERRQEIMNSRSPWLAYAEERIGVTEIPGPESHWLILAMAEAIGLDWYKNDDTAWCAVFGYGCLKAVGLPVEASALAQSFREYGTPLAYPVPGAIGVVPRGSVSWQGHVFFVSEVFEKTIRTVDGNSRNQVRRATQSISALFPDGIRWPPGTAMTYEAAEAARDYSGGGEFGRRLLRMYDSGSDVKALQKTLTKIGVEPKLSGTGYFGPKTKLAVEHFQQSQDLVVDGIAGEATFAALEDAVEVHALEEDRKSERRKARPTAAAGGAAVGAGGAAVVLAELSRVTDSVSGVMGNVEELFSSLDSSIFLIAAVLLLVAGVGYSVYRWFR